MPDTDEPQPESRSYLEELLAKASESLANWKHVEPTSTDVVIHDRFDEADWKKTRDEIPAIGANIDQLAMDHGHVEDLYADLHHASYKARPEIRDREEMDPKFIANHEMINDLTDLAEFKRLRQHTVGDSYSTAAGMVAMEEEVNEAFKRVQSAKEATQARLDQMAKDQADLAQAIQDAAGSLAMQPGTDPNGPQGTGAGMLAGMLDQFDQNAQQQSQAQQQQNAAINQAMAEHRAALRKAANEATQQLDDDAALASGFGLDDGELKKMPVGERIELMKRLRANRLAEFAKILGQFRQLQAAESRRKIKHAATEIHGVTYSDDITKMTPGEYLNFADPSLETLMWARWAEHQLLTYDVRGTEKVGQGPIIFVCDESGSMGATDCGGASREAWSKAFALAMVQQAKQKDRNFTYIGFSSPRQQYRLDFPKGVAPFENTLTMAEHFFNGGTEYETPLTMALQIAEEEYDRDNVGKPDIVFVTDDDYGTLSPDFMAYWNRVKAKTSLKCYGIAIGCSSSGALAAVSDDVREITELASDPRAVSDIFRTV